MSKDGSEPSTSPELPTYASVREEQLREDVPPTGFEHHRFLENGKGKKWLSMFVKSRAPNAASLPVFVEGDTISGQVEIDLDKPETSKSVTIAILAGTTFVGQEEDIFLNDEQTLWRGSKLSGKHSWPFTFALPREVAVKESDTKKVTYTIPPHFSERASPAYIDYRIVVTVKRGFLKVNQTLITNFGYQPITFPEQPSLLRRLAYSEHSPLLGQDADPEGWKVLPEVKIKGKLFNVHEVEVTCTLAVAKPLSYAVGTHIPLILTFTAEDARALDVLTSLKDINLKLRRSMATGSEATNDNGAMRTDNYFEDDCGMAYFWVRKGEPNKRVLHGELEVAKNLKPTFKFPKFTIRYALELLPFTSVGFTSADTTNTVLLKEDVKIATRQIPGLIVHSYAPPGYEKPRVIDYNKSLGLLENGNQRFLGHHHGSGR